MRPSGRPPESPNKYAEAAALVTRLFNLPIQDFLERGYAPHMRTAVISREGHVLMVLITENGGFLFTIFPPNIARVDPSLVGRLAIERDFSHFNIGANTSYTIEPTGETKENPAVLTVVQEVCDSAERLAPQKLFVPALISRVRSQIRGVLGDRVEPRSLRDAIPLSRLQIGAADLYRRFFERYQNHDTIIQQLQIMRGRMNDNFDRVAGELPPGTDAITFYILLNYVCDNSVLVQRSAES